MRKNFILIFVILSIFFGTMLIAKETKEVIVKLKDNFQTTLNTVKLKDIGMVIGDDRLQNITIVTFNNRSDSFLINKQLVYNNILNFYMQKGEKLPVIKIFSKNNYVKIKRKSYFVTFEKIKKILNDFLHNNESKIFGNKHWKIVKVIAPEKIKLNCKRMDIKVSLLNEKRFSNLPFILDFLDSNHNKIKSVKVFVITEVKDSYVVAKRNISLRKILTFDDVEVAETKVGNNRMNYFKNINNVIGKVAKRFIRKGEPINDRMIKVPPMVNRGDIVDVVAKNNSGITISMKGKALENGYYNKNVRILNRSSGKVIVGIVKGFGKVVINF